MVKKVFKLNVTKTPVKLELGLYIAYRFVKNSYYDNNIYAIFALTGYQQQPDEFIDVINIASHGTKVNYMLAFNSKTCEVKISDSSRDSTSDYVFIKIS